MPGEKSELCSSIAPQEVLHYKWMQRVAPIKMYSMQTGFGLLEAERDFAMRVRPALLALALCLAGCATAPRGPAASLADAGSKTTGALGSEIRSTGAWVGNIDVSKSFAATWDRCQNLAICAVVESDPANLAARQKLVQAIQLRARAVDAIGKAYEALAQEADYDARTDLEGAVGDAVSAVNAYSSFVLSPGAALVGAQAGQVTGLVAGLLAERSQRKRLRTGSQAIGRSLTTLRQGLQAESGIYQSIQTYVVDSRTDARLALYQSGLVSRVEFLKPLAEQLGVTLLGTADATLGTSVPARTAVEATIKAQGQAEARKVQAQYDASLAALDALQRAHGDFEQERPVSLADVARFLAELDAALDDPTKEEGK